MQAIRRMASSLYGDQRAVTALEYAIIGSLIAIVILSSAKLAFGNLSTVFSHAASDL